MPIAVVGFGLVAAGLAAGVHLDPALAHWPPLLMAVAAMAAAFARAQHLTFVFAGCVALTIVCGAAWRGVTAVEQAEHPPLVRWLDERVGGGGWPVRSGRMDETVLLRGRLLRDAAPSASGVQLLMQVSGVTRGGVWEPATGGAAITVGGGLSSDVMPTWWAGRVVELPAQLRRPARYLNEGVTDGARAMARRGTALAGSVKSDALVEVVEHGWWWDEAAASVRATVREVLERQVAPHDQTSAAIGIAILIGDRAQMSPDLEQRLQAAGTYHVVAISGGNIALLAAVVLAALWAVGIRFGAAAVGAALVLLAHAWIIGGGASVVRATAMAVTYLALRAIDQRTPPANAIAVAAGVMLWAYPLDLFNAGLWLTFGASGALLALAARQRTFEIRWWHAPVAICAGTLTVEVVLMPVSAYVFQRVTMAGLLANLVAVPAMGVVQGAASVCVLADVLGLGRAAAWAGTATHLAARLLVESSRVVDVAPWSTWRVPSPSLLLIGCYYVLLGVWWCAGPPVRDGASIWRRPLAMVAAAIWVWMATAPLVHARAAFGNHLSLTAIDVGQGDALLLRFPNGRTMMVDAGGLAAGSGFDIGERVVAPALRARGLGRLDYVAITHGDADHAGGAATIVRDFRPAEVWWGVPVPPHELQGTLVEMAAKVGSAVRWLQVQDRLNIGDVELRVHHPPLPDWERQRPRNDDSLVLEVRYGDVSLLLTGDIGREVEWELEPHLDLNPLVVLKAPHHGSASSSSMRFLERVRPRVVLVSAGRGNLFGHPAPAVLGRYADVNAVVFRTDRDGQVDVMTDGRSLEVRTFTGLRWRAP